MTLVKFLRAFLERKFLEIFSISGSFGVPCQFLHRSYLWGPRRRCCLIQRSWHRAPCARRIFQPKSLAACTGSFSTHPSCLQKRRVCHFLLLLSNITSLILCLRIWWQNMISAKQLVPPCISSIHGSPSSFTSRVVLTPREGTEHKSWTNDGAISTTNNRCLPIPISTNINYLMTFNHPISHHDEYLSEYLNQRFQSILQAWKWPLLAIWAMKRSTNLSADVAWEYGTCNLIAGVMLEPAKAYVSHFLPLTPCSQLEALLFLSISRGKFVFSLKDAGLAACQTKKRKGERKKNKLGLLQLNSNAFYSG